jgi:hypothetical protein
MTINGKALSLKILLYSPLFDTYNEGNLYLAKSVKTEESRKICDEVHSVSLCARSFLEASLDSLVTDNADEKITPIYIAADKTIDCAIQQIANNYFSDYFNELWFNEYSHRGRWKN